MLLEERSVGNEAVHAWEIAIGHMSGFLELLIDAEGLSYRIEAAVTAALAAEQEIAAEDAEEEEDEEEEDDEEDEDEDDDEDLLEISHCGLEWSWPQIMSTAVDINQGESRGKYCTQRRQRSGY